MFGRPGRYRVLIQQYGLRHCLYRMFYDLRCKSGLLKRRFPPWQWEDRPLEFWLHKSIPSTPDGYQAFRENCGIRFFFPLGQPPKIPAEWVCGAVEEAEELLRGNFRYFSQQRGNLGWPNPDWLKNPFTGYRDNAGKHWCDLAPFDPARGDIKYIWEPSKFGWAYALARAYAAEPKEQYAQTFWQFFESWLKANPPQMGPNWLSGQEIAIRLFACIFGAYVFWNSPATTNDRIASLIVFLGASAERIAGNINYARAQMGNHAVSEAAGLLTVGLMFPELKGASSWLRLARYVLTDEVRKYNFADGSYTQHSMNYHRLMLHDYLWCLRLGELNELSFSELINERLKLSYQFLYQLQDPDSSSLPNYGPNDGAMILPLNDCDHADYRPIIGAMHFLFKRERLYDTDPWSEDLLWLFGPQALKSPIRPIPIVSSDFLHGGYFTMRGRHSWAMVRCHSYCNRPNQADMLHLDLWWNGINVLCDSGSFTYYDPKENWHHYFPSTFAHNTVTVAGLDQMIKGARFQWYSLVKSRFIAHSQGKQIELWQGEHYGYQRLPTKVTCRRTICRMTESYWVVIDDLMGHGREKASLLWHLPDYKSSFENNIVQLFTPEGVVVIAVYASTAPSKIGVARGETKDRRIGWQSLYYGQKRPSPTLYMDLYGDFPLRFITFISLGQQVIPTCESKNFIIWPEDDSGGDMFEVKFPDKPRQDNTQIIAKYAGEVVKI